MNEEQINQVLETKPVVVLMGINSEEVLKFIGAADYIKNTMMITATVAAVGMAYKGFGAIKNKIAKKKKQDTITIEEINEMMEDLERLFNKAKKKRDI